MADVSEDLVITAVLTVAVFVIAVVPILNLIAAPGCDGLATQTAIQLKFAIDEVTKSETPFYTKDDVPEDPIYFRTVPIKLCQRFVAGDINILGMKISTPLPGYAYWLQFFGGFPEYQIYYERFPEIGLTSGVPHLWAETYPWSGGAASGLFFWAVMRGVTISIKYTAGLKIISMQKTKATLETISEAMQGGEAKLTRTMEKITDLQALETTSEEYMEIANKRTSSLFPHLVAQKHTEAIYESMAETDFLLKRNGEPLFTDVGRPLIFDGEMKVKKAIKIVGESGEVVPEFRQVYVKIEDGDIVDMAFKPKPGFEEYTVNPAEEYRKYLNELKNSGEAGRKQASFLEDLYEVQDPATNPALLKTVNDFENGWADTQYYKKIDANYIKIAKGHLKAIQAAGYNIEMTTLMPTEVIAVTNAITDMMDDDLFYEKIIKPQLDWSTKIKNGILEFTGLKDASQIKKNHFKEYHNALWSSLTGIVFLPRESSSNILRAATDIARDLTDDYLDNAGDIDANWDWFRPKLVEKLGEDYFSSLEAEIEVPRIKAILLDINDKIPAGGITASNIQIFETDVYKGYLKYISGLLESTDSQDVRIAEGEIGMLRGFLERNTETIPIDLPTRYTRKTAKRIVYMKLSGFLPHSGWIAKGILATQMTEGCQGNSICLYSHNAESPESPYYLEERSDRFTVRVWRPVNEMLQYANIVSSVGASVATGITEVKGPVRGEVVGYTYKATKTVVGATAITALQSVLMQIPEHPRFYVVSPCFAVAKVWKTVYEDRETVFVSLEKIEMEGKASNYCYADQELVNKYMTIWLVTDVWNVAETLIGTTVGTSIFKSIITWTDSANLAQAVAEASISWPGAPYDDMTYEKMNSESGKTAYNDLLEKIEEEGFSY